MSNITASQTVGPFFKFALDHPGWSDLTRDGAPGEHLILAGRVLDGDGVGVPDALLELWGAGPDGSYEPIPGFRGFGRVATDPDGRYAFRTVRPGAVPGPGGTRQAPHLALAVFARGLLHHLITRAYFDDRAEDNARDPVLTSIADPAVRATLLAAREPGSDNEPATFRFDIVLQGERETAFFDL
jgi:protocatechuate 3,4-dioxygenase alpha subunit